MTRASVAPRRCSSIIYRQHALPIKVARIFNTYGPGMQPDDGQVVSNFIIQALTRGAISRCMGRAIRRGRSAMSMI